MRALPFVLLGLLAGLAVSYLRHRAPREAPVIEPEPRAVAPPVESAAVRASRDLQGAAAGDAGTASLVDPSVQARLDEIVLRLEAIEAKLDSLDRRPVGSEGLGSTGSHELRSMVVAVLKEAAAAEKALQAERQRLAEQEEVERRRGEIRFQVGMMLAELGETVRLSEGQKEVVIAAVVEMEERRQELQDFDPATADPEVVQREFDSLEESFWLRLEADLGVELAAILREHF